MLRELEQKKPQLDELVHTAENLRADTNRQQLHGKGELHETALCMEKFQLHVTRFAHYPNKLNKISSKSKTSRIKKSADKRTLEELGNFCESEIKVFVVFFLVFSRSVRSYYVTCDKSSKATRALASLFSCNKRKFLNVARKKFRQCRGLY